MAVAIHQLKVKSDFLSMVSDVYLLVVWAMSSEKAVQIWCAIITHSMFYHIAHDFTILNLQEHLESVCLQLLRQHFAAFF